MHLLEVRAGTWWILVTDNIKEKPALTSSVLPWFELIISEVFVNSVQNWWNRSRQKMPSGPQCWATFDYKLQKIRSHTCQDYKRKNTITWQFHLIIPLVRLSGFYGRWKSENWGIKSDKVALIVDCLRRFGWDLLLVEHIWLQVLKPCVKVV